MIHTEDAVPRDVVRERAAAVAGLLRVLDGRRWSADKPLPDVTPYLHDASDDLVELALARIVDWRAWEALPEVARHFPGDPRRPRIRRALKRCLRSLTGRGFESRAELVRYLESPGVRRRIEEGSLGRSTRRLSCR